MMGPALDVATHPIWKTYFGAHHACNTLNIPRSLNWL
jgi:hypothetical protein